jgi:serine/threonine-protein kinase
MGAVYEAVQEPIERRVAIKILHGRYAQEPEIATRFFNEARAVNIVDHPGIVQISDYGQLPTGVAYLVMEFLKGETLGQRIKRASGRMPVPEVVRLARQIAAALAAAHEKGVIHRDLKPDNVMLVPDPDPESPGRIRVKLLDFGIAKVAAEVSQSAAQTAADVVMGTPKYMSPEQCRGAGNVDDKSDVYALGIICFEMLVGKPPFVGATGEILAKQIYDNPPQLRDIAPWVPEQLAALVHRLLVKGKADRPAMRQVTAELETMSLSYPTTMHSVIGLPALGAAGAPAAVTPAAVPIQSVAPGQVSLVQVSDINLAGLAGPGSGQASVVVLDERTVNDEEEDNTPTGKRLAAARSLPEKDSHSGLQPQSTLGFSVGESSLSITTPPRTRRLLLGIGAGGLAAVAVLLILLLRGSQPTTPTKVRVASKPPKRSVHWSVSSDPAGADVVRVDKGETLGRTPWQSDVPIGSGRTKLRLTFPGYQDREVELDASRDDRQEVLLDPDPAQAPPPSPGTPPKPKPKPKPKSLWPFKSTPSTPQPPPGGKTKPPNAPKIVD